MPPTSLLSNYRFPSGSGQPRPRIYVWLALSYAPLKRKPKAPFRVLLDTGFDGTLVVPASVLADEFGTTLPRVVGRSEFGRVGTKVPVTGYELDLWGCAEANGPARDAPTARSFLATKFPVWVWNPPSAAAPPALLGTAGLVLIEAELTANFRSRVCHLRAEEHDPPY